MTDDQQLLAALLEWVPATLRPAIVHQDGVIRRAGGGSRVGEGSGPRKRPPVHPTEFGWVVSFEHALVFVREAEVPTCARSLLTVGNVAAAKLRDHRITEEVLGQLD